jgi:hypothetical protein
MINLTHLKAGSHITYKLKPSQSPVNPEKLWTGKVISYDERAGLCWVEVLTEGYTGLKEFVYFPQIVEVGKETCVDAK